MLSCQRPKCVMILVLGTILTFLPSSFFVVDDELILHTFHVLNLSVTASDLMICYLHIFHSFCLFLTKLDHIVPVFHILLYILSWVPVHLKEKYFRITCFVLANSELITGCCLNCWTSTNAWRKDSQTFKYLFFLQLNVPLFALIIDTSSPD